MEFKYLAGVPKRLNQKPRKFWELVPTFAEATEENW